MADERFGTGRSAAIVWSLGMVAAAAAVALLVSAASGALAGGAPTLRAKALNAMFMSATLMAQSKAGQSPSSPEIERVAEKYRRAVLAGDPAAIAAIYTEDGVELAPGHPPVRGRAAIEQRFRECCGADVKMTSFTFSHLASRIEGGVGYDVGTYDQTLVPPSGQPVTDHGKYAVILEKPAGGEWRAAYVIYNSDAPSR